MNHVLQLSLDPQNNVDEILFVFERLPDCTVETYPFYRNLQEIWSHHPKNMFCGYFKDIIEDIIRTMEVADYIKVLISLDPQIPEDLYLYKDITRLLMNKQELYTSTIYADVVMESAYKVCAVIKDIFNRHQHDKDDIPLRMSLPDMGYYFDLIAHIIQREDPLIEKFRLFYINNPYPNDMQDIETAMSGVSIS